MEHCLHNDSLHNIDYSKISIHNDREPHKEARWTNNELLDFCRKLVHFAEVAHYIWENKFMEVVSVSTKEDFVTELFNQYYPMLRTLCWRYVDYDRLFADIVDESILDTFVQAYSSYDHLRSHPNVQGWLIITCLNRLKPRVKQLRNREKHHAFSMDDPHVPQIKLEESWEEGKILQLDARDQIDELCTALTETERQVYQEHYVQGFTLQEVAHHCHRSLVSVKASLRQIKKSP